MTKQCVRCRYSDNLNDILRSEIERLKTTNELLQTQIHCLESIKVNLTDEEIIELSEQTGVRGSRMTFGMTNSKDWYEEIFKFARLVESKILSKKV